MTKENKAGVKENVEKSNVNGDILRNVTEDVNRDEKPEEKPENKYNDSGAEETLPDLEKTYDLITEAGIKVKVYENIDVKDVLREPRFTIRITNGAGCHADIDMFAYRDIVLDYAKSEEAFIKSKIERMSGIYKNIDETSKAICHFLSVACYKKELQIKRYKELGWDFYGRRRIFKYDEIYSIPTEAPKPDIGLNWILGECENEVSDSLINKNDDTYDYMRWLHDFSNIMNYSPMNALIIATACTGVVRQLLPYTKENNINMNIVGGRASGKSTISHFALSMFGDPSVLEGSFTDTDNAVEKIRAERTVLPYILDERMLKIEGSTENTQRRTLLMDIFREYEGKVKERLAGQGKELSGKRTMGPIISSSVEPILDKLLENSRDLGQYRRFIELKIKASDLFEDAKMAETTEMIAYTHYGHGIYTMVSYMLWQMNGDENFIIDLYNEINHNVSEILRIVEKKKNLKGMLRPCSQRFALIITTLEILLRATENQNAPINIFDKSGWIDENLNDQNINKIIESINADNENENLWESALKEIIRRMRADGWRDKNLNDKDISNAIKRMKANEWIEDRIRRYYKNAIKNGCLDEPASKKLVSDCLNEIMRHMKNDEWRKHNLKDDELDEIINQTKADKDKCATKKYDDDCVSKINERMRNGEWIKNNLNDAYIREIMTRMNDTVEWVNYEAYDKCIEIIMGYMKDDNWRNQNLNDVYVKELINRMISDDRVKDEVDVTYLKKLIEQVRDEENKQEKCYLEESIRNRIINPDNPKHTRSENVLGILIDNAVEKMKRLKSDVDIYGNIMHFIKLRKNLFFLENIQWKGKDGHIGQLLDDGNTYTIQIRKNKYIEWILVYGVDFSDEELISCVERLEKTSKQDEAKKIMREVFGDVTLNDFASSVEQKYKDQEVQWNPGDPAKGKDNIKLAKIVLKKDVIDAKEMKDSDKEGNKKGGEK